MGMMAVIGDIHGRCHSHRKKLTSCSTGCRSSTRCSTMRGRVGTDLVEFGGCWTPWTMSKGMDRTRKRSGRKRSQRTPTSWHDGDENTRTLLRRTLCCRLKRMMMMTTTTERRVVALGRSSVCCVTTSSSSFAVELWHRYSCWCCEPVAAEDNRRASLEVQPWPIASVAAHCRSKFDGLR